MILNCVGWELRRYHAFQLLHAYFVASLGLVDLLDHVPQNLDFFVLSLQLFL